MKHNQKKPYIVWYAYLQVVNYAFAAACLVNASESPVEKYVCIFPLSFLYNEYNAEWHRRIFNENIQSLSQNKKAEVGYLSAVVPLDTRRKGTICTGKLPVRSNQVLRRSFHRFYSYASMDSACRRIIKIFSLTAITVLFYLICDVAIGSLLRG